MTAHHKKVFCYSRRPYVSRHISATPPAPLQHMNDTATLRDVETWLARASGQPPIDEIKLIRQHLRRLDLEPTAPRLRQHLLEGLHIRAIGAIDALMPRLHNVRLPISNHTRQTVRAMQETLDSLARLGLNAVEAPDPAHATELGTPTDVALWRIFEALTRHLSLSNLIAAPAKPGAWFNLHRGYLAVRRHRAERSRPNDAPYDLQTLYARTLIAGALPPSALSAQEWAFLHRFLACAKRPLSISDTPDKDAPGATLWVSPEQDMAPILLERRPPASGTLAIFVHCDDILTEIRQALTSLIQGSQTMGFVAEHAPLRTARITLRRLREHLSSPRKRRFPRHRQSYRATLCVGFEDICRLLKSGSDAAASLSEWMVVNESPGGYAAMHLAGPPQKGQVGDLVALRRDGETNWSISVVRWALSENPEHLEFGLEEVSPRALSGYMTTPGQTPSEHPAAALLLPPIPPLRDACALAFSPGSRPAREQTHIFVADREASDVSEFRLAKPIEQSSGIDICLVTPGDQA